MCEPTTILLAATAAGTALTAYGQYQQGQAAEAQGRYQAAVSRNNQIIAERMAKDALERGKTEEALHRQKVERFKGAQRAALAKSGVVVDQGSALDVLLDTAEMGELDALTIRSNAEREAYGYRVKGMNFAAEGELAKLRGKAQRRAANIQAMGTILGGTGQFAERWIKYKG